MNCPHCGQPLAIVGLSPDVEQPRQQPAFVPNMQPAQQPYHHDKPMRQNARGWYCATRLPDGSWCQYRPTQNGAQAGELP